MYATARALLTLLTILATDLAAEGIDCRSLAKWSPPIDGVAVNQHHVFCGEAAIQGRIKGLHAMPGGAPPTTFIGAGHREGPNAAGLYTLDEIRLQLNGTTQTKSFSTLFPEACSRDQVLHTIVYAFKHARESCAHPGWAVCGPSAPIAGDRSAYCLGDDGSVFTVAAAPLPTNRARLNTGFPIFQP